MYQLPIYALGIDYLARCVDIWTSALKATGQNTKAPRTQRQDSVKTSSNTGEVPPTDSTKPVKHKNK